MRVSACDFLRDTPTYIRDVELALLFRKLRVEDDLEQQVAQLFAERAPWAAVRYPVHFVEDLVGLLEKVGPQGSQILLAVPRAAALRAQAGHDPHQPLEFVPHIVSHRLLQGS